MILQGFQSQVEPCVGKRSAQALLLKGTDHDAIYPSGLLFNFLFLVAFSYLDDGMRGQDITETRCMMSCL